MSQVSTERVSLLDRVSGGFLLRCGGEADIYRLLPEKQNLLLKWYKNDYVFNQAVVEKTARTRCPGLYKILEWGMRDNHSYLVYEFVDGLNSGKIDWLPVPVALFAMRQIVATLATLSKQGVSHGDLSPSNVILTIPKDASRVLPLQAVLIDSGINGLGAPAYAAPERFQGAAPSEKSDIYSLGMLLYRWIVGNNLLDAESFDSYAAQAASIESLNITEKIYLLERGALSDAENVSEILDALDPIWKRTLRLKCEDRAEDFDELDELLEIALDKISGGGVALVKALDAFAQENIVQIMETGKMRQKVPESTKTALPYKIVSEKRKFYWRQSYLVLGIVFILLLFALLVLLMTKSPDIDATGKIMLRKSRSVNALEMDAPTQKMPVDSLLKGLPTPDSK